MIELPLIGLDGANALGFLAALGALRTLDQVWRDDEVRLVWRAMDAWRPVLVTKLTHDTDEVCACLHGVLRLESDPAAMDAVHRATATLHAARKRRAEAERRLREEAKQEGVAPRNRRVWIAARLAPLVVEEATAAKEAAVTRQRAFPAPHLAAEQNLKMDRAGFRELAALSLRGGREGRYAADFVAAFAFEPGEGGRDVVPTPFRFVNGGKHQHFLPSIREIGTQGTAEHYRRVLFSAWDYADARYSLRWDPADDRRYALRWDDPAGERAATMWGATRLAFEALPFFPCVPTPRGSRTVGWTTDRFTWPLWDRPASADAVRALLSHPALQSDVPDRARLRTLGVSEVYRATRFDTSKGVYSFLPGAPA